MAVIPESTEYTVVDTFGDDFDVDARPEQSTSTAVQSGWEAAEKLTPAMGDFPREFKNSETIQIIKFLDATGPFAIYRQHFLQQKMSGPKSYVCLGATCPLCLKLGHRPEDKRAFTIANLSADPIQKQQFIASTRLYKQLHAAEFSPQGPLTKNYWAISRSGQKQNTVYTLNSIKARDLGEDWGIDAEAAEAVLATMTPFTRSVIRENSYAELLEIANDLA